MHAGDGAEELLGFAAVVIIRHSVSTDEMGSSTNECLGLNRFCSEITIKKKKCQYDLICTYFFFFFKLTELCVCSKTPSKYLEASHISSLGNV